MVAWTLGDQVRTVFGGMSRLTGLQSRLELHPIVAVHGGRAVTGATVIGHDGALLFAVSVFLFRRGSITR